MDGIGRAGCGDLVPVGSPPIEVSGKTFSTTLSVGATLALAEECVDTITARADAAT
ncbi:hypothetical protein MSAS_50080 [Mycobacterium saskatchewanense]|nr:hypothetical protein MSAS_50080 [Mycobacterium saskatchewanense]